MAAAVVVQLCSGQPQVTLGLLLASLSPSLQRTRMPTHMYVIWSVPTSVLRSPCHPTPLPPDLEFLELNMTSGGNVDWDRLAQLPALHSLMLVPPISPHSSGHGPEHAQQVRHEEQGIDSLGAKPPASPAKIVPTLCPSARLYTTYKVEPYSGTCGVCVALCRLSPPFCLSACRQRSC